MWAEIGQRSRRDSRALTLTGNLPPSGVVLASRDSSRAFIYVEDIAGHLDLGGDTQPISPDDD